MNWVDLCVLVCFAFALSLGFQRGFVRQVVTMGSVIAGIILAGRYHPALARHEHLAFLVRDYGEETAGMAAYVGIFAITVLGFQGMALCLRRAMEGKTLGQLDSLLGGALGAAKVYAVLGLLALASFQCLPAGEFRRHISESALIPRIAAGMRDALASVPDEYRERIGSAIMQQTAADGGARPWCAAGDDRPVRTGKRLSAAARSPGPGFPAS